MKFEMKRFGLPIVLSATLAVGALSGCAATSTASASDAAGSMGQPNAQAMGSMASMDARSSMGPMDMASSSSGITTSSTATSTLPDLTGEFTDRDLEQTADTSGAKTITVSSGQDVTISEEGVYVISGTATDCTITVDADSSAKVQLVLDGVNIANGDAPAIYVASADKVFVTTASGSTNELSVTGAFAATAEDNFDGVIYAKDDLVLNGLGTLAINSTDNGIVGKDDVKVTGGTYNITVEGHGIEGKDSVAISDGTFTIKAGTDGIHSENSDDDTLGYVYIAGGTFKLDVQSDGIEGDAFVVIDGGTVDISAEEGIEGTFVQINGGKITVNSWDDGINASIKSSSYVPTLEINDGSVSVTMASGDTDALDSNGYLYINGGTVDISAQFAFDYVLGSALNGGTVTVNGEQVTEITESTMMGGMGGGMSHGMGGQRSQIAPSMGSQGATA